MSSVSFLKAEISFIMDEMVRIIDSLNELANEKHPAVMTDWPPYCEEQEANPIRFSHLLSY